MVIKIYTQARQETFRSISRSYYKNSVCAFIVYDITKREIFDHIISWYEDCKSHSSKTLRIVLVRNKVDLDFKSNNKLIILYKRDNI